MWTSKAAVGWAHVQTVTVTIDLGSDQPITGGSVNTSAGVAGVEFPDSITVLTSLDNTSWAVAGELVWESDHQNGPPPSAGYAVHRYWTDRWRTHGRWVRFVVAPGGEAHMFFTDEIEVYTGDQSLLTGAPAHTGSGPNVGAIYGGIMRRRRLDLARLENLAKSGAVAGGSADMLRNSIQDLRNSMNTTLPEGDVERSFRAVMPLDAWQTRLFGAQAHTWRDAGVPALVLWVPDSPYDPLPYITENPLPRNANRSVSLSQMGGETRSVAVNLVNSREKDIHVRVSITGLPGGPNPAYIDVRHVEWTDTLDGGPIASALLPCEKDQGAYELTVTPGLTAQLWLRVTPGADVPAGVQSGQITVSSDAGDKESIPLHLQVLSLKLPAEISLHTGGFDYTDADQLYGLTPGNRQSFVELLRRHLVDSTWATSDAVPSGAFNAAGDMTQKPDTARFDRWVALWKGAARYCVFVNGGSSFAGSQMGTPDFDKKVGQWAAFWLQHAESLGLHAGQLVFHLVDEPRTPAQDQRFIAWAAAVKSAAPGIVIWVDPTWSDPRKMSSRVPELADVLSPNRTVWLQNRASYTDFYAAQRARGKGLGFYATYPLGSDPYAAYRLQAWQCYQEGGQMQQFWSFADNGGASSWDPYIAKSVSYTPLFLGPDSVTTAKPLEAIREGIEDYQLLDMLRQAADARRSKNANDPSAADAERLLTDGVSSVLRPIGVKELSWSTPKDRTQADRVREQALRLLVSLGG